MFERIREQISENPRRSGGFSPAREFSQTLPRFSPGYGGTENMFCFLNKSDKIFERKVFAQNFQLKVLPLLALFNKGFYPFYSSLTCEICRKIMTMSKTKVKIYESSSPKVYKMDKNRYVSVMF